MLLRQRVLIAALHRACSHDRSNNLRHGFQHIRALFDHPIPGLILTGETDPKFLRECTGHDVGIAHKPGNCSRGWQKGLRWSSQYE
jgi:hypothetical protein